MNSPLYPLRKCDNEKTNKHSQSHLLNNDVISAVNNGLSEYVSLNHITRIQNNQDFKFQAEKTVLVLYVLARESGVSFTEISGTNL